MKEYLMTLSGVMILSVLIGTACAEGNVKKYVRLLCALCLLCALISPLLRIWSEGDFDVSRLWENTVESEEDRYDEIYHQALIRNEISYAERLLKKQISERFNLDGSTFDTVIETVVKNGTYEPSRIRIILRDEAIFADPTKLIQYVNQTQKCECVIIYD